MENIVVGAVVALAGIWVGLGFFRRRKASASCASGCSGCAGSPTRAPQPLAQIRR
jgi:hypothetical protein